MKGNFLVGFTITWAIFACTNFALAMSPLRPWIWEPYVIDAVNWTGWPFRFIGFGGFVGHWEVDLPALWISLMVVVALATLTGVATKKFAHRWHSSSQNI